MRVDYDLMGAFLSEAKMTFARSNKVEFNLANNLQALLDQSFPENLITQKQLCELGQVKTGIESGGELFNMKLLTSFVQQVFKNHSADYGELMHCFPDIQFIYHFYNMTEYKWFKRFRALAIFGLSTNTKFKVNLSVFENEFMPEPTNMFKWRVLKNPKHFQKCRLAELREAISFEKEASSEKFQIRMIAGPSIDLNAALRDPTQQPLDKKIFEKVIIQIHGGGFIGMTSSSHMFYLRKYATEVGAVVFCIDYPLAPRWKYREITDSVFKAYLVITVGLSAAVAGRVSCKGLQSCDHR